MQRPEVPEEAPAAPTAFPAVRAGIDRVVEIGQPHLSSILGSAAPTPTLLRALAEDLRRAAANPRAVAHPDLVDPEGYWKQSAWPQAAAAVKHVRLALVEIANEVLPLVRGAEATIENCLRDDLSARTELRLADPDAARDAAIDTIAARCEELHRVIEGVRRVRPEVPVLAAARAELEQSRRRRAEHDVKHRRAEEERAHAEMDKREFKRWWSEMFAALVEQRHTELRAEAPFRHQELLLEAFDQARATIDADIDAMVVHLTEPILGIGERLVVRYDQLVTTP